MTPTPETLSAESIGAEVDRLMIAALSLAQSINSDVKTIHFSCHGHAWNSWWIGSIGAHSLPKLLEAIPDQVEAKKREIAELEAKLAELKGTR